MRRFFLILVFLVFSTSKIFSQSDSLQSERIFSLSYINSIGKISEAEDVSIISIDSNSLSFQNSEYKPDTRTWEPVNHKIEFNKISSFGYKSGLSKAEIIGRGALVGFGAGFILGCSMGRFTLGGEHTNSSDDDKEITLGNRLALGVGFGAVFSLPAILISAFIPAQPYENLNISKYDIKKKSEIIKRLIKKGIKENI